MVTPVYIYKLAIGNFYTCLKRCGNSQTHHIKTVLFYCVFSTFLQSSFSSSVLVFPFFILPFHVFWYVILSLFFVLGRELSWPVLKLCKPHLLSLTVFRVSLPYVCVYIYIYISLFLFCSFNLGAARTLFVRLIRMCLVA